MTLAMVAKITFAATATRGELVLRKPTGVSIEKSWQQLTDTATITMPRNVRDFDKSKVNELFKKDDPVTIELGYDGVYVTEFVGYIARVSADIPIKIECEDEMRIISKTPVNASLPKTTLANLFIKLLPGVEVDALEVEIGTVRFAKTNMGEVLKFLKDEYSLYSYMKGKTLVCGKIYADDTDVVPVTLHLEKNVVNNSLNYRNAEDIRIKINAVSTLANGTKIEVLVGDENGDERQLAYYGIEILAELEKLANEDLKKYKVDGFDGTVATFGIPFIEHGYKVNLVSFIYPDRNGVYYVERVKVDFDASPQYRRTIELGEKVA
ncbi:hypothetical protein [Maribacter sp. ACAM166]|uniref:hypothetical protein n=1 Tax=Maribacter sp. ACAM166 TaxID=2508996 RepID=UPI0010FF120D|nr:hypothetical protein [Maribacter sp. ACAM166]TLP81353.1 hypothetical protein ES765_04925 [Maribacter sp. ACAM166]